MIDYYTVFKLWAEKKNLCFEQCNNYGEKGYTSPEKGILFANWNDVPKRILDGLQKQGFELEWSDEWYIDYDNDKAWRTSPDSYGWVCSIAFKDNGKVLTPDDDISDWIEYCQITKNNNLDRLAALPDFFTKEQIEKQEWIQKEQVYENGFHAYQTDDPKKITKELLETYESIMFQIYSQGQFDTHFVVYVKDNDENVAD